MQPKRQMMNKPMRGFIRISPPMLLAGMLCVWGPAVAQNNDLIETDVAPPEAVNGSGQATFNELERNGERRLEVGMSLQEALELVGTNPDSEEEIGAACGMLDVHTWDEDGTRIISVDGTVTSIFDGKAGNKQQQ